MSIGKREWKQMRGEKPLTKLRTKERAVIVEVPVAGRHLQTLLIFGVLPGVEIEVVQTFPGVVLAVGNTLLALDWETANTIWVKVRK